MKRLCLAIMAIASLAMLVACSEKKAPTVTGVAKTDQKVEKAEKKLSEMTGPEKCEATWKNRYEGKLTLADVQPDFDYAEKLEGYDCFMGNGVNLAKAVYCKKDGSEITPEEWNAYITKMTREQALEELPVEQLLNGKNELEWGFLRDDRFEACYLNRINTSKNKYVTLSLTESVQKNLDEALKDAFPTSITKSE